MKPEECIPVKLTSARWRLCQYLVQAVTYSEYLLHTKGKYTTKKPYRIVVDRGGANSKNTCIHENLLFKGTQAAKKRLAIALNCQVLIKWAEHLRTSQLFEFKVFLKRVTSVDDILSILILMMIKKILRICLAVLILNNFTIRAKLTSKSKRKKRATILAAVILNNLFVVSLFAFVYFHTS